MRKPAVSASAIALAGVLMFGCHTAAARDQHRTIDSPTVRLAAYVAPEFTLSPAARHVSEVAAENGDRNYLMVDKVHGQLIQFANGVPVFIDSALTGASLADRLPPEALSKTYAEQYDIKYRVTPAGRFTVSRSFDYHYGAVLDINEIKGKDWSIAIHSAGSASRFELLRSSLDQARHVTEGCINVGAATMRRLAVLQGSQGRIPLYILPMDESLIMKIFSPGSIISAAQQRL
jgi:hypothetical protein